MSSSRKTQLRFFDVMDYEKEAEYLSSMHARGWRFVYVAFPGFYHFVKCEPAKVRYQLDYNEDGITHRDEYIRMFEDMDWEYLLDFMGYSYFRKGEAEDGNEDIFCDDDSRMEMMKRIFRGRMVPLIVLFLLGILPTLGVGVAFRGTEHALPYGLMFWMTVTFVLYLSIFVRFTVKYLAFRRKLKR